MPKFKVRARQLNCAVCGTQFEDVDGWAGPTCENPNCIREARKRGMLFATPTTKDKLAKGRRRRASKVEAPSTE